MQEKNKVLTEAFGWLFIGLIICFLVSYVTSFNETIIGAVYGSFGGYGYLIFAIVELILVIYFSVRITKLSPTMAKILYIIYTALTGLSLSGICIVYTASSICYVFLATALIFGSFAIIGKTTKVDLSKWGIYLFVALIASIILEVINIFLASNSLNMILSIGIILLFSGYVAFDVQNALRKSYLAECENKGIYCAFQLFIDFINIFIKLLNLFGKRRD